MRMFYVLLVFRTGDYHYSGVWKSNANFSYYDATAYLTGRYATDPNYAMPN